MIAKYDKISRFSSSLSHNKLIVFANIVNLSADTIFAVARVCFIPCMYCCITNGVPWIFYYQKLGWVLGGKVAKGCGGAHLLI